MDFLLRLLGCRTEGYRLLNIQKCLPVIIAVGIYIRVYSPGSKTGHKIAYYF